MNHALESLRLIREWASRTGDFYQRRSIECRAMQPTLADTLQFTAGELALFTTEIDAQIALCEAQPDER